MTEPAPTIPNVHFVTLVFYAAENPDVGPWVPVHPQVVPAELKASETIKRLLQGDMAQITGSDLWYRAMQPSETVSN